MRTATNDRLEPEGGCNMGKIRDRLNWWKRYTPGPHDQDVALRYVESADPQDLAAIQKSTVEIGWLSFLRFDLNLPPNLDDEDRRTLHVLAAIEDYRELLPWLEKALAVETPSEDVLGTLRGELKRVGLPHDEITSTLIAYLSDFQKKGQLNSVGRYVLALSDQQLKQIVSDTGTLKPDQFRMPLS
jgi:hypothetical protein